MASLILTVVTSWGIYALLGMGIVLLVQWTLPAMPATISPLYVALSLALAVLIGAVAGVLPARSAARLEPLDALRAE